MHFGTKIPLWSVCNEDCRPGVGGKLKTTAKSQTWCKTKNAQKNNRFLKPFTVSSRQVLRLTSKYGEWTFVQALDSRASLFIYSVFSCCEF